MSGGKKQAVMDAVEEIIQFRKDPDWIQVLEQDGLTPALIIEVIDACSIAIIENTGVSDFELIEVRKSFQPPHRPS